MIFARCANIIMRACELRRLRMGMVRVGDGRSRVMICVDVVEVGVGYCEHVCEYEDGVWGGRLEGDL